MARTYDTVSFLSDLGWASEHVGVVKAVIRETAPHVSVIDLVHEIAPFDIRAATLALARAVPYLNEGVVIAAVDPGAASSRRVIAVEVGGGAGIFIGPDNGVVASGVALAGGAERAVVLDRVEFHLQQSASVFRARDVMAPVAAALCAGVDLFEVGTPIDSGELMPGVIPIAQVEDDAIAVEVLWVDQYGNCQLNASVDDLVGAWGEVPARIRLTIDDSVRNIAIANSYEDVGAGALGIVTDAHGLLSVIVDRGSASVELGITEAQRLILRPGGDAEVVSVSVRLG